MIGLDKLGTIIKETGKAIKYLSLVQHNERARLVDSLVGICSRCESSFEELHKASEEIRTNFGDNDKLIESVSNFIKDDELAAKFKPEHLCSEISDLLVDLSDNLSPLKYSVAVTKVELIRMELGSLHDFDISLNHQYQMLRQELQDLCDDYRIEGKVLSAQLIRDTLNDFIASLQNVLDSIRSSKKNVELSI